MGDLGGEDVVPGACYAHMRIVCRVVALVKYYPGYFHGHGQNGAFVYGALRRGRQDMRCNITRLV